MSLCMCQHQEGHYTGELDSETCIFGILFGIHLTDKMQMFHLLVQPLLVDQIPVFTDKKKESVIWNVELLSPVMCKEIGIVIDFSPV